tara:strand:+ start:268 stop:609 length:342 start_codon:yes stop_codon:yes gene_type:complete
MEQQNSKKIGLINGIVLLIITLGTLYLANESNVAMASVGKRSNRVEQASASAVRINTANSNNTVAGIIRQSTSRGVALAPVVSASVARRITNITVVRKTSAITVVITNLNCKK